MLIVGLGAAGDRGRQDLRPRPASRNIIGCDRKGAVHTDRADYQDGSMPARQALVRRAHQPRASAAAAPRT